MASGRGQGLLPGDSARDNLPLWSLQARSRLRPAQGSRPLVMAVTAPRGHGATHGFHGAGHCDHGDGERPAGPASAAA
jgi:hypothetical protein